MNRLRKTMTAAAGASVLLVSLLAAPAVADTGAPPAAPRPGDAAPTARHADTPELTTWGHDASAETTGPIADDEVRGSAFYETSVSPVDRPGDAYDSFTYMSVPRSGEGKIGYDEQDGAEFAADAGFTMSWSSFEYATDVWVTVRLTTGRSITSADQVTVRPTDIALEKELVDDHSVRVKVPFSEDGLRISVEFDPELVTVYNDGTGDSGKLTTDAAGNRAVHTEPRNSMLVFANPKPDAEHAARFVPTEASGSVYRPQPGLVDDLDGIDAEIVFFGPGTYLMGSDYHAQLPPSVRWVYLAPGAYVKGAFRFPSDTQPDVKVTGLGVLSGEQYVYEPDTRLGYQHSTFDNCHAECVKMLQFESSNQGQTLDLEGVTINQPPYHSFVVYAHEDGTEVGVENFRMTVENYKQVGSWYWQTDGIELYPGGRMKNTFFHANDDVLKLYHSDVAIENTVIWKNENGPVMQWGWGPREVDGVSVTGTDIIHNRMGWKDEKFNTCVFNSASSWQDPNATDRADPGQTVRNLTFTDTRVEGMLNCGIRIFAMSNHENITIDGFSVDAWNELGQAAQASRLRLYTDGEGRRVSLADEMTDSRGLSIRDYTVGGELVLKAGDNWAADETGRLDFDADTWNGWNATGDDAPTGPAPTLSVEAPADGTTVASRDLSLTGSTDAARVIVRVGDESRDAVLADGRFTAAVRLPDITNRLVVTAVGADGVRTVDRRTLTALGTEIGALADPVGDDHGPGTYTYPTDGAFVPGSFDLTAMMVYDDDGIVRFVTRVAGPVTNPWGGDGMSTQRLNVYLRDGASQQPTALLPGTNTAAAGAWSRVVVADGRYPDARFGAGVYDAALDRVGDVELQVDPAGVIIASLPASALGDVDLATAGYQVSMFSGAEESEGVGGVRPVYSAACVAGDGCPSFAGPYRFGGGAGVWTGDDPARDTDLRDSNAIDIISGAQSQADVLDWERGPATVPYVALDPAPQPEGPEVPEVIPPGDGGSAPDAGGAAAADPRPAGALAESGAVVPLVALTTAGLLLLLGAALLIARTRTRTR